MLRLDYRDRPHNGAMGFEKNEMKRKTIETNCYAWQACSGESGVKLLLLVDGNRFLLSVMPLLSMQFFLIIEKYMPGNAQVFRTVRV